MRKLILLSLAAMPMLVQAKNMHVVVHTRDREVVKYICEDRANEKGALAHRTIVRYGGSVTWHGVGGVAPYTVIDIERDALGNVCITAMDALGSMATGCGLMIERTHIVAMECGKEPSLDSCNVRRPEVTNSTICSIYRPDPEPDPRTDRPNKEDRKGDREPKPREWTDRRTVDRDVRDPGPSPRPTASHDRGTRGGSRGIYRDAAPSVDRGIHSGGSGSGSRSGGGSSGGSGSRSLIHEHYGNTGR